jgi:hypothetical protein
MDRQSGLRYLYYLLTQERAYNTQVVMHEFQVDWLFGEQSHSEILCVNKVMMRFPHGETIHYKLNIFRSGLNIEFKACADNVNNVLFTHRGETTNLFKMVDFSERWHELCRKMIDMQRDKKVLAIPKKVPLLKRNETWIPKRVFTVGQVVGVVDPMRRALELQRRKK